jgi:NTE family protein
MADAGLDVRNADLMVGTSAGARIALELASGKALEEYYQRRVETGSPSQESAARIDWDRIKAGVQEARQAGGGTAEILRRMGALALEVASGNGTDRRSAVAKQIPMRDWPSQRVLILSLLPPPQAMRLVSLDGAVDGLRTAGSLVEVVHPDEETLAALASTGGALNPAYGRPAAMAGRLQGRRVSERIASFWG